LVTGCQSAAPSSSNSDAAAPTIALTATAEEATPVAAISETAALTTTAALSVETLPPVRLAIPEIDFATTVEPMAWRVTEVEGERQAVWEVPENNAGWHINSATVGAPANLVISGHHRQGAAIFAPLARGEVVVGDQILVTDSAGRVFRYDVTEVAEPLPVAGATDIEREQLNRYLSPADTAKLTLMTGWPDFSDTHYLMIVADLVGELE
jgi:sortase (surface protein transpeptidase)